MDAIPDIPVQPPHLRSVVRTIQEREDIPLAVLFGSYAKWTADQKSDIDVYIETGEREVKRELERCHSRLSIKIGPWDQENLLIREIAKNHVIIKGVERYFESTLQKGEGPDRRTQRSGPGGIPEEVGELSHLGIDPAGERAA
ncbi:nucleotidyltransferase family protein [Methanofollis fontis]|uniref:nucleotidyltransferase family protein n=1 Tax=Methanofollis fontis TaxID=2052832 RepID=UPI0013EE60EF|nr:nucleotidyltransferase domain-containing protein [Methanofollis fontis]